MGVYLVNLLVPESAGIRILGQSRSPDQSRYALEFARERPARREGTVSAVAGTRGR